MIETWYNTPPRDVTPKTHVDIVAREIAAHCAIVINGRNEMPGEQIQKAARAIVDALLPK